MRAIFITLVVINIAVFAGQWFLRTSVEPSPSIPAAPILSGSSLQLLAETEQQAPAARRAAEEKVLAASVDPSGMCSMIGPYGQLLRAEYLVERLHAIGVGSQIRSIEVPDGVGFWVHLPPEISEQEALRRLHEVQAKNIDSYLIPSGELARGISLGMFNERSTAEARIREIREQGYHSEIREVIRTISETWVVLPIAEAEKVDPETWMDALRQQSGLEKRQNYCLGVAPDEKFL
jgi:hypothetical protein